MGPGTTGHWNVSIALGRSFTPASYLLPAAAAAAADTFTGDDNNVSNFTRKWSTLDFFSINGTELRVPKSILG